MDNEKENSEEYDWYKVDKEMWNVSHLPDKTALYESIKKYDGLITLKDSGKKVLARGYFKEEVPADVWSFWYANGQLAKEFTIPKTKSLTPNPVGPIKEWYADGKPALEGYYGEKQRGEMIGTWKGWNEAGEVSLREGKRTDDGMLWAVLFNDNDKDIKKIKDGYRRYMIPLQENKKAYFEGYCKNSLRQEFWKFWLDDGRILSLTYYKDGLPDGFCVIIDPYLFSIINFEFKKFTKDAEYCPYLVYFKDGALITKEEYEKLLT